MRLTPTPALVKRSLASHSWLGVTVGALMYLVCLSGTLAVLYPQFERWEQPAVAESPDVDPAAVQRAYEDFAAAAAEVTHHMYVALPHEGMPRASVSSESDGRFFAPDGTLGPAVAHDWTHMLIDLHLYLNLPEQFGMIIVSALGALLTGLILSGLLAHPRLVKDAFLLRLGGSRHLEQADIHNRLSVWGAPFHLMIAITGAYFGLAALLSLLLGSAYFDGDTAKVSEAAFGSEPELGQPQGARAPDIARALTMMAEIAPRARPFFVTVEHADQPAEQYLEVSARHDQRLIWAEQYRFDAAGNYLDRVGYADGELGRQAIFSIYRLHFGHFGGLGVQLLYVALGLTLTVVSATGIGVWLARRRGRDRLNDLWAGFVWGAPAALTLTGITGVLLTLPSTAMLWMALTGAMVWAVRVGDESASRRGLQRATAGLLVALVTGYALRFQDAALGAVPLGINLALLAAAGLFACLGGRPHRRRHAAAPERADPVSP
ncbi:MAG: PepSY domain-containing protein [Pseudomonadota bacterium]